MRFETRLRFAAAVIALSTAMPVGIARAQELAGDSEIRAMLARRVLTRKNPGIVVGIYDNGRTRIIAMGESGAPNDTLDGNTVFEIGSITKVFTSTLLADMVARGLVAFDDPVAKHLPPAVRVPSRNGR